MGAIGGILGFAGGQNGTGISGPGGAPDVSTTVQPGQLESAYTGAQNSLASQQALMQALQAQNGIQNQSNVYGQLQGVANGTGPNPAAAMLAQATGANSANQAALMAGQRGASANTGLIARQAGQQGAANQQNAAGQAATMQANQSLNALGQAGQLANTQAGNQIGATTSNTQAQQSEQQILQNAQAAQNAQNNQMQENINNVNAGLAGQGMQATQGIYGGMLGGAGSSLFAKGGEVKQPVQHMDGGGFLSGWSGGGGNAASQVSSAAPTPTMPGGPQSLYQGSKKLGQNGVKYLKSLINQPSTPVTDSGYQMPDLGSQFSNVSGANLGVSGLDSGAAGDVAGAAPSLGVDTSGLASMGADFGAADTGAGLGGIFGEGASIADVAALSKGGNVGSKLKQGGKVPGKAPIKGNSFKNDTVKALLSPGETVIPRSVMQSADPVTGAAKFVAALMAKKKVGGK